MYPNKVHSAELQVHFLGSSADLTALRRSLEARGAVSRSRLTPTVTAVVADTAVPLDHPTLVAARELGIDVYDPAQAIDRLLSASGRRRAGTMPLPVASTPLITATVIVLIGVFALLGVAGALNSDSPSQTTTIQDMSEPR